VGSTHKPYPTSSNTAQSSAEHGPYTYPPSLLTSLYQPALAVALRKLNASYARRTRDLDKARAHVAVLRGEADSEEQTAKVDEFTTTTITVGSEPQALFNADPEESVAGDDDLYEDDTSSNALHDVSGTEVVNVTGKAVATQARLMMMRTDRHPSLPPPYSLPIVPAPYHHP